jgi:hypothetical protein
MGQEQLELVAQVAAALNKGKSQPATQPPNAGIELSSVRLTSGDEQKGPDQSKSGLGLGDKPWHSFSNVLTFLLVPTFSPSSFTIFIESCLRFQLTRTSC